MTRNIPDLKRMENNLGEAERSYRSLIENIPDGPVAKCSQERLQCNCQVVLQQHLKDLEVGLKKDAFERLSLRERDVLQLLAEGKSIKEIAVQLYVSPKTVETHKYNMMAKLDTNRLADLIKIAIRKK